MYGYQEISAMLVTCPHCYTRVLPKADGSCPACQKDTREISGADLTRASIRIEQGQELPGFCCDCGQATNRYSSVYCVSRARDNPSGLAQIMIALVSWPMALYFFLRGIQNAGRLRIKLPQCERCATRGTPLPQHVDFENARATFVVNVKLCEASNESRDETAQSANPSEIP